MSQNTKPVLIIGAGIVGLTLAQGLLKAGIPFIIFERDAHISARGQGWAITLHWVLPFLREVLSAETLAGIEAVQVDPEAGRHGLGKFVFLNLETLEPKFLIPPGDRRRVNREKLRNVLLAGVAEHVRWSKRLSTIEETPDGVTAVFADGSRAHGALLVGVEGSNSSTRKFLAPDTYKNIRLPFRFTGAALDLTPAQVKPLRDIDPLLFQGCHPDPADGAFFWFSMLETPETNGTRDTPTPRFRVQVMISWPFRAEDDDEVKTTDAGRLANMRARARRFHPSLRDVVDAIPEGAEVTEIVLQDWPCLPWDNRGGRVTLAGDAAHAMTMYRGEAANHGILDAYRLFKALESAHKSGVNLRDAVEVYEAEMRDRTSVAVLLSRQACIDAHNFPGLNENSAVLKRRAISGV
ncbi:hypothetical protein B0T11DRAFT_287070 [Plectosphaerella cucumerina]|uniref:FAD-binding domain-containing protein n=1 Tax=Plectosphaerella cucumerina TaxID=40658 RepID=A0A8K0WZM0_9PEZI|nr:hypothetical protein B0T11DRAFT_287070 [Plectosphaerella cucumerina]